MEETTALRVPARAPAARGPPNWTPRTAPRPARGSVCAPPPTSSVAAQLRGGSARPRRVRAVGPGRFGGAKRWLPRTFSPSLRVRPLRKARHIAVSSSSHHRREVERYAGATFFAASNPNNERRRQVARRRLRYCCAHRVFLAGGGVPRARIGAVAGAGGCAVVRVGLLGRSGSGACPNLLQRRPGSGSAARRAAEYQRFASGTPARWGTLQQIRTTCAAADPGMGGAGRGDGPLVPPPGAETLERAVPTIILECEVRLSARSGPVAVVADRGVWPARTAPRPPPSPRRSGSADRRSRQKGSLSGLIGLERVARPDGRAVCDAHEVQEVYEIGWLAGAPSASVKDGRTVLVGAAVRSREPGSWRCRTDECG